MTEPRSHLIATPTHGRCLVDPPAGGGSFPVLLGFHGYAESAAVLLPYLARLDPGHDWIRVSVQGLHRFYNRANQVVASWMTREDRLAAIADNLGYAAAVRTAVAAEYPGRPGHVVVGFSQGAAQAYRAAADAADTCCGVIALGGDLPPDVAPLAGRLPPVFIGHGRRDEWYTAAKLEADVATLRGAGAEVTVAEFDGGHGWADAFVADGARWLAGRRAAATG